MFQWTDRYLDVTVPDYSLVGTLAFWIIVLIQQLDNFALPGFMFVSGFFLAFMAKGQDTSVSWNTVFQRVRTLAIPFLFWTLAFFIIFQRRLPSNFDEMFDRYYYIVLLAQYYVFAPFVVPFARKHWKLSLGLALALEFIRFAVRYLDTVGAPLPGTSEFIAATPHWLFPTLFFWFVLGIVAGFKRKEFAAWLASARPYLIVAVSILAVSTLVEYWLISRTVETGWLGPYFGGVSRFFYSLAFILFFLSLDNASLPFQRQFEQLGTKSLGIYLVHARIMYVVAVFLYRVTPEVLGMQWLYQSILIVTSLFGSLLLMEAVKRSPARGYYRYLFG